MRTHRRDVPTNLAPLKVLRGLALLIHPFPATAEAVAGTLFFFMAVDGAIGFNSLILFGSIFLIHAAIGISNDYCDFALDSQTKPGKPLVRGDIKARTALLVAYIAATAGTLLSFRFGWTTFIVSLTVLASGLTYNFWAKRTIYSWVPYAVAIPALPVWGFLAADKFTSTVLLSFPLGVLISLALNLANTLPDLTGDVRNGVKGLTHRLGQSWSIIVIWCAFGGALGLLALTPAILGNNPRRLFPGLVLGSVILLVMVMDRATGRSDNSLRRGWYFSAILAIVLGGAWVASISSG
jgi:geranylgeranylglycerol-phosphate geranylgeranyltransferase